MKLYKSAIDMAGEVVGQLVVVEFVRRSKRGNWWRCCCECGNDEYEATAGDLRSGRITSCGCYRNSEEFAQQHVTHGQRRQRKGVTTRTYRAWAEMKRRCNDPTRENYKYYGGKGISYPVSWHNFAGFYEDLGECPDGYELDRIRSNESYSKDNCRWLTKQDNIKNRDGRFD